MMNINGMAFNARPNVLEATAPAFCAVDNPSCAAVALIADICVCTSSTPVAFNALLNKVADAVLPVKLSWRVCKLWMMLMALIIFCIASVAPSDSNPKADIAPV